MGRGHQRHHSFVLLWCVKKQMEKNETGGTKCSCEFLHPNNTLTQALHRTVLSVRLFRWAALRKAESRNARGLVTGQFPMGPAQILTLLILKIYSFADVLLGVIFRSWHTFTRNTVEKPKACPVETTQSARIRNVNKNFWIVHGIKVSIAMWRVTIRKLQPQSRSM